jgi:chitinase
MMKKIISLLVVSLIALTCLGSSVKLTWNPNTETDLSGYCMYSGTNSGVYTASNNVGNITTNVVNNLMPGKTYFFAVTAKNTSGLESDFSNEVSVTIPIVKPSAPTGLRVISITNTN